MCIVNASRVVFATLVSLGCTFTAQVALAEQAAATSVPQIVTTGSAEVLLPAAKASFSIGVMISAPTSAAAGESNARVFKAVSEALLHAGLKPEEIKGSRLTVSPRWTYDPKTEKSKRSAFEANHTLQIETENLDRIGAFIDTALSAGATDASQIAFFAKDVDTARRQALSQAVVAARGDAETMAHADGGTLSELLLLSSERANEATGVELSEIVVTASRRTREPVSTEVTPSQIRISATVHARWRFIPAPTGH